MANYVGLYVNFDLGSISVLENNSHVLFDNQFDYLKKGFAYKMSVTLAVSK